MSGGGMTEAQRELMALLLAEEGVGGGAPEIVRGRESEGPAPLSSAQLRLWFLHCVDPRSIAFNVPSGVHLRGALDLPALHRAWTETVRRHEVLRTTFPSHRGDPVQRVAPPSRPSLPVVDLSSLPAAGRNGEALRLARGEARGPFDLERGPLLRLALLALEAEHHVLLWTVHHIVFDGWSRGILIREVVALYRAFAAGEGSPLAELPVQYGDFARWQREWSEGPEAEAQLAWWRRRLERLEELELPADRAVPRRRGFRGETLTYDWPPALAQGIQDRARRAGTTPFVVLLAALKALLADWTGQTDVAVGTDVAGRDRLQTENLVGFFINQLVLRTDLTGDPSFRDLVERVGTTARESFARQDLPFDRLVKEVVPDPNLERLPLFQVKLIYQPARRGLSLRVPGLAVEPLVVDSGAAQLDLTLSVHELAGGFGGWVSYSTERFERRTIEGLLWRYERLLDLALADPAAPLSRLAQDLRDGERARQAEEVATRAAQRRDAWATRRVRPVQLASETIHRHESEPRATGANGGTNGGMNRDERSIHR